MTSPAVDQSLHYARKNWPILSALVAGAVLYGVLFNKVEALEDKSKTRDEDHDAIVRVETEVSSMKDQVAAVVAEQKTLHSDIVNLERRMNENFTEILQELRNRGENGG